ncbi:MAG: Hsp70 family protein [bacterium]
MRLGIDFGTTRTVVASVEHGSYPVCTFDVHGEAREFIPSLVAVRKGELRFGWEAAACLSEPEARVLRSVKRLAATHRPGDTVDLAPGHAPTLLELLTGFLTHVREMIRTRSNLMGDTTELAAMVATPASANSNQRYLTLEAFERAGFDVIELMNEPSAAAVEYVHRALRDLGPRSPKRYVAVYDLGGGTFDTSVVGFADQRYEVLTHTGIGHLGGDDFDLLILERAVRQALAEDTTLDAAAMDVDLPLATRLLEECRERKEGLTPRMRKLLVDLSALTGRETEVLLPTPEVYEDCEPLIRQTVDAVQGVLLRLAALGIDPEDSRSLAAVYLVGGSAAFPPVARALRETFGRKVQCAPYPHAATAIGLALAADPEARVRVQEVASRHFGVWRELDAGRDKVFDALIAKDNALDAESRPLQVVRRYRPTHNIGHLRYMECGALGADGQPVGDLGSWQEIHFPYDPGLRDSRALANVAVEHRPDLADHEILETYTYEPDGIIRVEIENRTAGYRRVFSLGRELSV